jgi:CRP-like cAMP-binding protein
MSRAGKSEKNTEIRASFPLLELLPAAERARVLAAMTMQKYAPGETIYERGEDCTDAFFVFEGRVKVCTFGPSGEMAYFWDKLPGDFFGYYSAITEKPQTVRTAAVENTLLGRVKSAAFMDLVLGHRVLSEYMLKYVTGILRLETSRMTDLLLLEAPVRLAAALLERVNEGGSLRVGIPARAELASRLGMTRETLARHLSDLAKQGIIEIGKDAIQVLDAKKLSEICGQ